MTGLATGPHLHYEYLSRGVHMDPQKVALPTDMPVPPAQMARFREAAAPLLASLATGDVSALVAARAPAVKPDPATAATPGAL
jgi:murein DD-endopeptidase MepM/ murein hydrolase activator NlpD